MESKVFAILVDKETAEEENVLLSELSEKIKNHGCESLVLPPVERLTDEEAAGILRRIITGGIVCAGKNINKEYKAAVTGTEALSDDEKEELAAVNKILDGNLLTYHFQPIISAETGEIFAYEALMRSTLEGIDISPYKLLKYAEMTGRLGDVEKATFINVTGAIDERLDEIKNRLVFINSIPGAKLLSDDYVDIESALIEHKGHVVVEITEQTEAEDAALRAIKKRYDSMGIGLALDDYGTGYSNVINLLKYMPSYVKIDRSLLENIDEYPKKQRFVREIIEFCHDNNIYALAEGVETAKEMRAVIRMGVDLIQGFYTAKPSEEIIDSLDYDIVREIRRYQEEYKVGKKQPIYVPDGMGRLNLSSIEKIGYSCIMIGNEGSDHDDIVISGYRKLKVNAYMEIKSNYMGRITLENINLVGEQGKPCVAIGENCDVTFVLKGDNHFEKGGILVPESSKLKIEGAGNLNVFLDGVCPYGIGNDLESGNGDLVFEQDGVIAIETKGNNGVCIGSGKGGKIALNRGKYNLALNCGEGVGVGSFYSDQNIHISNCEFEIELAVTKGVGIGSVENKAKISATNSSVKCSIEGTEVVGYGTLNGEQCDIHFYDTSIYCDMRGDYITAIAALHGETIYHQDRASVRLTGSGSHALAFGSSDADCDTIIYIEDSDTGVDINTACQRDTYAKDENIHIRHGKNRFIINGYPYKHKVVYD